MVHSTFDSPQIDAESNVANADTQISSAMAWRAPQQISLVNDHPAQAELIVSQLRLRERNHHLTLLSDMSGAINLGDAVTTTIDNCLRILVNHLPFAMVGVCLADQGNTPTVLRIQTRPRADCAASIDFIRREAFYQEVLPNDHPDLEVKYSSTIQSQELAEWALQHNLPIFGRCSLFCEGRRLGAIFFFADQYPTDATRNALLAVSDQLGSGIARRQSNEVLKLTEFTLEKLATAIFWIDERGSICKVNAAACALTGRSAEELLSTRALEVLGRSNGRTWRRVWNRLCSRESVSIEGRLRQKASHDLAIEVKGNVVQFKGARYFCAMVNDISARKVAERKLRQSELALRTTLDKMQLQVKSLTQAYILLDSDLRIVDWNPYAEHIFEFKKAEVLGRRPFHPSLTPVASQAELKCALSEARGNMHSWITISNVSKTGRELTCEWTIAPVQGNDGKVDGVLCLAQDVTRRLQLEERCKRGQRLESIGGLAAGIAHDFNNVLTIIMGFADVMEDGLGKCNDLQSAVHEIKSAGDRGRNLTSQLMTFSRNETPIPQSVCMNETIETMKPALEQLIGSHMKLVVTLSDEVQSVFIAPGQLEQVLLNLISNARDAMARNGEIQVRTSTMCWSNDRGGKAAGRSPISWSVLTVSDSGCGMSEQTKQRIFDPFFTTKEPGKGTGLGLAIVYAIVSQAGGYLDVRTEVDRGSTITVSFPNRLPVANQEKVHEESSPTDSTKPGAGKVIFVVETDEVLAMKISTALSQCGFHVLYAKTASEAVWQFAASSRPIDLVISRLHPAVGDYCEFLNRATARDKRPQVLFISGHLEQDLEAGGLLPQGAKFLQKPFTAEVLSKKVYEVLGLPL